MLRRAISFAAQKKKDFERAEGNILKKSFHKEIL